MYQCFRRNFLNVPFILSLKVNNCKLEGINCAANQEKLGLEADTSERQSGIRVTSVLCKDCFTPIKLQNGEKQVVVVVVKDKKDAGKESIRTPCGLLKSMYFKIQNFSFVAVRTCSSPQNTERGPR